MNKRIISVLIALFVFISMSISVSAQHSDRTLSLVEDYADVLTIQEESALEEKMNDFCDSYKTEIAVVTVNSLDGKTAGSYADDFYDYNGYGFGENDDGLLVLYVDGNAGERELYITTHGTATEKFTDSDIDFILDIVADYISCGDFYEAFDAFILESENVVKVSVPIIWIPLSLAIGILSVLFILKTIASANKSVARKADAKDYVRSGSMVVTNSYDNFLFNNVTRVARPKNTSSGSTVHSGSSGRTHGGGGIKF